MLASGQAAIREDGEAHAAASSLRASPPVTQVAPPLDAAAVSLRDRKLQRPGEVVDGRYVLIEQLGKGGMGVVWKARSTALDVEVAVKLVRSSTPNADAFKRMAREAHAAARLGHPAMATVLDFGATPDGDPYVVMELLRGESLGDVLAREQRVDALRAVSTLLPIIDGLREAHDKGIVHRDIKPENLFISKTARGRLQPKVLDFGIAKLEQPMSTNTKLTQDGAVLGSPGYFSPEQARGETDIDSRTDIWSISVVLYELITGELPFTGANYNALLMAILKETPKSFMAHGRADAELWRIVQRGLMRDRSKRWASMWELGRALAGWLHDQGVQADVTSRSLKEVWLDARTASEQAPAPFTRGVDGMRRRVFSTIKRRVADTLAGETISTLMAQRHLPPRLLGWSAAAVGGCAIIWSMLAQSATERPAALAAQPTTQSAEPIAAPPVSPARGDAERTGAEAPASMSLPGSPPVAVITPIAPMRATRSQPEKKMPPAVKTTGAQRTRMGDAVMPKATRAPSAATRARPNTASKRRGIDQEFGF